MLNKNYPLPIYYQLKELIREKIVAREWQPGDLIPSERELSEQYDISRMTARQALTELTNEGLLHRVQGKGTFVAEPKIEQPLTRLTGFTEDMRMRGVQSKGHVLRLELVASPTLVLRALRIMPNQPVVLLERLRLTGADPIALEACYLHFNRVQSLMQENFEGISLYNLLIEKYDITPTRAEQQVGADLCSRREQELLNIAKGSPVLRNKRVAFDQRGQPFEYTESAYRADRYVFQAELVAL
ncbi:MAG: GntR family transcriptional regulator [Caldilineaceae bacterium]|nr:GntR family transcriptional regulator [Caldilineaceae bacterium]